MDFTRSAVTSLTGILLALGAITASRFLLGLGGAIGVLAVLMTVLDRVTRVNR